MTTILAIVVLSVGILGFVNSQNIQSLSNQEVNNLLGNSDLVQRQIGCVLGRGGCDNIGNQIKLAIPEVLGRNCRSCSAQQASNARRIISFIQRNYPTEWSQIQSRYRQSG